MSQLAGVGTDGADELNIGADDVVHAAAVELADGDDQRIDRVILAADVGLQRHDYRGSGDDGVVSVLRSGAVGLESLDADGEVIAGGHAIAGSNADIGSIQSAPDVLAEDGVNAVEDVVIDIVLCAAGHFLTGLEQELDLALELILLLEQDMCRAEQHGHVVIVAAGMHDALVLGSEVKPSTLLDGQSVYIGAQHDGSAGLAGVKSGDQTGIVGEGLDLHTHLLKLCDESLGGLPLLEAELGMRVEVSPALDDIGFVLLCQSFNVHKSPSFIEFLIKKGTAQLFVMPPRKITY